MKIINGKKTTEHNRDVEKEMLMTHSEEEKQQNEINKTNAKHVFNPKFIPVYPNLLDQLTNTEALIFGFIDFYKNTSSGRFYFTNEQLATIVRCSEDTVSRAVSKLEKLGFIETSHRIKAGGGTIRFVNKVLYNPDLYKTYKSHMTFSTTQTTEKLQTNNNKINNNKNIYRERPIVNEEFQEALQKKEANKVRRALKKKYGGQIPPWVSVEEEVSRQGSAVSVPPSVSITQEYRDYCEFVSKDRPGSHIPLVEGQKLWNNLLSEGYTPVHIRVASEIAYRVDSWWKEHFTPELFFRKISSQGKAIDNIGKFYNYRDGSNSQIIEIKKRGEHDLKNNTGTRTNSQ